MIGTTSTHEYVRPGQVAPDSPPPDACVVCGLAADRHQAAAGPVGRADELDGQADELDGQADELDGQADELEPYCSTCGEWIGYFVGLEGWQHFRGDGAPGGDRELFDAGHPAEVAWTRPPGRTLSPASVAILRAALADAIEYRQPAGNCTDCETHPAGLCDPHADDLDQADLFATLAKQAKSAARPAARA